MLLHYYCICVDGSIPLCGFDTEADAREYQRINPRTSSGRVCFFDGVDYVNLPEEVVA